MPCAAIVNSRQPLRPHGGLPWVRSTLQAVMWAAENQYSVVSSLGIQTYELVTYLAGTREIPLHLLLPQSISLSNSDICASYGLTPNLLTFERLEGDDLDRDRAILEKADIIVPISVRSRGNLHGLIELQQERKLVVRDFETPYSPREEPLAYSLEGTTLNDEISAITDEYLIHWTRSCQASWPGEPPSQYYRDVIASMSFPRTAFCTLREIMRSGKIIASSRHMPRDVTVVSFSSLSPTEVIPLMRWRARYRQMSFEPYGIGIRKSAAVSSGIVPVNYIDPHDKAGVGMQDVWRSQSIGEETDWRAEREYRHRGDLDLTRLNARDLIVFCRFRDEAGIIRNETGVRAVSFTNSSSTA